MLVVISASLREFQQRKGIQQEALFLKASEADLLDARQKPGIEKSSGTTFLRCPIGTQQNGS